MNSSSSFAELLAPHATGKAHASLVAYAELLERWSASHNLVSFSSRQELVGRHIADALAAAPVFPPSGTFLDVGSGAGLPGVPLLVASPGLHGTLLEPRQKRWAFLKLVIRELRLNAVAERGRYQDLSPELRWDRVTSRAVGDDNALLRWAHDRLQRGGEVVLWTTEGAEKRLTTLPGWRVLSSALPGLDRGRLCRLQPCFT